MKLLRSALLAGLALAAAGLAQARDNVYWSVGVDAAPGVTVGVGNYRPAPVYMAPQPVYIAPAPIYAPPPRVYYQPVYVQPAPVYYGYGYGYGPRHGKKWHKNRHHGHRH
jgi:hypothetical protein